MRFTDITDFIKKKFTREKTIPYKKLIKPENRIRGERRFSVAKLFILLFLILYTAVLIGMFVWGAYNSLKSVIDFDINPWNLPPTWEWENYPTAFDKLAVPVLTSGQTYLVGFWGQFWYSIVFSLFSAIWSTFLQCTAAYATSRFKYKSSAIIYAVIMVAMVLPIIGNTPSQLLFSQIFGYYDNLGLFVLLTANIMSTYYLVFHATFSTLPQDFMDAAKVDGANNYMVYFRIALPLVNKMFLTIVLLVFVGKWSDYTTPILYLPSYPVLAVGLTRFINSTDSQIAAIPMRIAGSFIVCLPMLIVFLVFRNKLMGNISMGGLKE